jgi:hypothetical protein
MLREATLTQRGDMRLSRSGSLEEVLSVRARESRSREGETCICGAADTVSDGGSSLREDGLSNNCATLVDSTLPCVLA